MNFPKTTPYAILARADDKHPAAGKYRGAQFDAEVDAYWFQVRIIEGYTTLDKETVANILSIAHASRFENIIPIAARTFQANGQMETKGAATWL